MNANTALLERQVGTDRGIGTGPLKHARFFRERANDEIEGEPESDGEGCPDFDPSDPPDNQ
jgi:hypothetical protein